MRGVCRRGCFNWRMRGLKCDRGGPSERCLQVRVLQLAAGLKCVSGGPNERCLQVRVVQLADERPEV